MTISTSADQALSPAIIHIKTQMDNLRSEKDFIKFYQNFLLGYEKIYSNNEKRYIPLEIGHLFEYFSCYQTPEQTATIINKHDLFKVTMDTDISKLKDFISATGKDSPFFTPLGLYDVERDVVKHMPRIVDFCRKKQSKSSDCYYDLAKENVTLFDDLLNVILKKVTFYPLERLLEKPEIPAVMLATKSNKMYASYVKFIDSSIINKDRVDAFFKKAKQLSLTKEFKDILVKPCPATKPDRLFSVIKVGEYLDEKNNYLCPVMERALAKMRD